jgi:hypothetical protein
VGGVTVAVTVGVVVYRFFAATKTITDLSVGLATHLPQPGGRGGHGGRSASAPAPGAAASDPNLRLLPAGDGRSTDGVVNWRPLTITGTRNNVIVDQYGVPHLLGHPAASDVERAACRFLNDRLVAGGQALGPRPLNGSWYFHQNERNPLIDKGWRRTVDGPQIHGTTTDLVKVTFIHDRLVSVDPVEVTESNAEPLDFDGIEQTINNKMKLKVDNGKEQAQFVVYYAKSDAEATAVANRFRTDRRVRVINVATGFDTPEFLSRAHERALAAQRPGGGVEPTPPRPA